MPEAARLTDMHECPRLDPIPHVGGRVLAGSPDILIEDLPAARATDPTECAAESPDRIAQGSGTVFFNDLLASRVDDKTQHGGAIIVGSPTVEVGEVGDAVTVLEIGRRGGSGESPDGDQGSGGVPNGSGESSPESSGEEENSSGQTGVVFAEFELARPDRATLGKTIVFRCKSWDPDTGGSRAAPNPEEIVQREWTVIVNGRESSWSGGTRNELEFSTVIHAQPANGQRTTPFKVVLRVVDRQGHTDETRGAFELHPSQEEIVAVIHLREEGAASREIARTGDDGFEVLPSIGEVVFEDHSYIVDADGFAHADRAIHAMWHIGPAGGVSTSGGRGRYQPCTFRKPGRYTVGLVAETFDRRRLEARARAVLDVGPAELMPLIKHHTHDASTRGEHIWTRDLQADVVVTSDTVTFHGEHEPAAIDVKYEWKVLWDGRIYRSSITDSKSITFPLDPGFTSVKKTTLEVRLSAVTRDGTLRSRRDASYEITVVPLLTFDNVYQAFANDLRSIGLTAAVGALFAILSGAGLLLGIGAAVVSATASHIMNRGLVELGLHPLLADVLTSMANIGASAGNAWKTSKDAWMKPFRELEARGMTGTHAHRQIANIWQSQRGHQALDPAARKALDTSFEEFTQWLVAEGVITDEDGTQQPR